MTSTPIPTDIGTGSITDADAAIDTGIRLEATGVSLSIGSHPILHNIDLRMHRGEVIALVGPNGAGKSTLLSVLAGDAVPSAGSVELDGRALSRYRPREMSRLRSVLTQSNDVSFPFTVGEVVAMGRTAWAGVSTFDDDERYIGAAITDADLDGFEERRVPELSGGERARVAYARVRAQGCGIMMLDEPTASLDIRHQERLMQQLRAHATCGGTAVVVLHDLNLAAAYADRVVVLENGRIRADADPATALTPELLSEVYRYPIEIHHVEGTAHQIVQPFRPTTARPTEGSSTKEYTTSV